VPACNKPRRATPKDSDLLSDNGGMADQRHFRQYVAEADARLRCYGNSRHGNKENPLDELIYIILSAQTESYSYQVTYDALAQAFPGWAGITSASEDDVATVIRRGGLAHKKARQIVGTLRKIEDDFGQLSLNTLRGWSDDEAEHYLISLPGIGVKSAKCILMYALDRAVFPVDTHVWKVCRRLGITPAVPKPTPAQEKNLEAIIAPHIRYTLHVNLVSHGQETCLTYWPKCNICALSDLCPNAFKQDHVWGAWRKPKGTWAKAVQDLDVSAKETTPPATHIQGLPTDA